jgi:hypothetical protein
MAITVLTNAYVLVNGVDLSDHVSKVTIEDKRDSVDITAMGATNKTVTKGLGDAQDHDRLLPGLRRREGSRDVAAARRLHDGVTVEVRPVNAARSATNPAALMTALLMNYNGSTGRSATRRRSAPSS